MAKKNTRIQLLPEHIIDQIKAGEVIERPSTLIKEIIENAIDAKATRIDLHLINNGIDLISIKDNGRGIPPNDLPLAFCRHATSKIDSFDDIYSLSSFGFRGEALASIASISKITCESITKTEQGLIKIEGGQTLTHQVEEKESLETGTQIYIKDLFFNTPVRIKFIQSATTEKNQITKILNSFLVTHPEIEFSIKWDECEKMYYPIKQTDQERINDALFKKKPTHFINGNSNYDGVSFTILLTEHSSRGNAHKFHYLFINDRFVKDIQLHKIILNSAHNLWPEGETGNYFAKIWIPSDEIDVNIHPNKTSIKLFQGPKIMALVSGCVRNLVIKNNQKTSVVPIPMKAGQLSFDNKEKTLDYKSLDFRDEHVVDNYFTNLHSKTSTSQAHHHHITTIGDMGIYTLEEGATQVHLIFSKQSLFNFNLTLLLEKILSTKEEIQIPLLISKPIKLKQKIKDSTLSFLLQLGYEVDFLASDTLVVRSFASTLQFSPYLKIIEFIIHEKVNKLEDIHFDKINFNNFTKFEITKLIETHSISYLRSKKLLVEIHEKDLIKIYEKK